MSNNRPHWLEVEGLRAAWCKLRVHRWLAILGLFGGLAPYVYLRGVADDAGLPRQDLVADIETFVAAGSLPSTWLQSQFSVSGAIGPVDRFWLAVYGLWFPAGVLGALWFAIRRWSEFGRFSAAWFGLFYGALLLFVLVPTEPPWMLVEVRRVVTEATGSLVDVDTNQVAAMPSLHVAMPAMIAFRARLSGLSGMAVVWGVFASLTAFSVVYLGEHFVLDTLAGAAFAWAIVRATSAPATVASVMAGDKHSPMAEPDSGEQAA